MHIAAAALKWHPTSDALLGMHKEGTQALKDSAGLHIHDHLTSVSTGELTRSAAIVKEIRYLHTSQGVLDLQRKAQMRSSALVMLSKTPEQQRALEKHAGPMPDDFCITYIDTQQLPIGCDPTVSFKVLYDGSERILVWWMGLFSTWSPQQTVAGSASCHDPMLDPADPHVTRNMTSQRHAHLSDVPQGSVRFMKRSGCSGRSNTLVSFSDVPQHALPLPSHGVHVAVNFVDLGVLAETLIAQQQDTNENVSEVAAVHSKSTGSLKWVGVEQSSFCCAKTLVILQLIRRGADAGNIAQVFTPLRPGIHRTSRITSARFSKRPATFQGIQYCSPTLNSTVE